MKYFFKKKNTSCSIWLILLILGATGCVSAPPLPATLNMIPPSSDVPPEIAAFSGIWEGKWGGMKGADTTIGIEKIDTQKAEILFSFGGESPSYFYFMASVLPWPVLEWEIEKFPNDPKNVSGCPCKLTFMLNQELNMLTGFCESIQYKVKMRADMTRRKEN